MKEKKNNEKGGTPEKKSKGKKIVGSILTAILVVVLVFFLVVIVQVKKSNKPFFFGYGVYFVLSGSMEPTIMTHDVIVVKQVSSMEDLSPQDIITYHGREGELAGKTVTHRIIRIEGDKIVTKGDSTMNVKEDPAITYDAVIGKYVKTSAFLTTMYSVFTSKYGFLFIVFIPLLILLIVQFVNFRRACKMDKDGKMPEDKSDEEIKEQAVKEKEAEIKRKAIEDYLASKKRIEKAAKDKKDKE